MVGAKLKSLFEAQAKKRQQAAGGDHGNQYTGGKVAVSANLRSVPETDNGKSRDKAAETVGAKLKSLFEAQAKKRQIEAAKAGGSKTSEDFYEKSVTKVENKVVENLPPPPDSGKSRDKAAETVGVSGKSVDAADAVAGQGQ